jgi:pimeloyl-ACP methyl ester carboxylesterase
MKVIVDGLATEYESEGSGPVVLMLHGWGSTLHSFDAIAKALSADFRIVRLDLPGFGGTEMPQRPWHVGDYAAFVADCMRKIDVEPYALVGHSFGGRIIIKGLAENRLHGQKAVLIAAAGVADRQTLRNWSFKMIAKAGKAATAIPPFTVLRAKLRAKLYQKSGGDYAHAGTLRQTFLNVISENLAPIAPQISIPTLLMWGSDDHTTPLTEGERLHALIPHSTLHVIAGTGHFVHKEKAVEVAEIIQAFLI